MATSKNTTGFGMTSVSPAGPISKSMQRFIGTVVGTAMQKTAKVSVERLLRHPKYPKILKLRKNYLVHDESEKAVVGDIVAIEYAGKKLSKRKAFNLTEIVYEAEKYKHPVTGQIFTRPAASVPLDYAINKN